MIFPHANMVNATEAPKVVGLIVFHLPVADILNIVNDPTARLTAIN